MQYPHHDPIIMTLNIDDCNVHHVLVDTRSSVDVLFYDTLVKMSISLEWLNKRDVPITRFLRK